LCFVSLLQFTALLCPPRTVVNAVEPPTLRLSKQMFAETQLVVLPMRLDPIGLVPSVMELATIEPQLNVVLMERLFVP